MWPPVEIMVETARMAIICLLLAATAIGCIAVGAQVAIWCGITGWTTNQVVFVLALLAVMFIALRAVGALWPAAGIDAMIRGV